MYAVIRTVSTQSCLAYCGSLGYPYSARSGIESNTGGIICGCGSEVRSGLQVADTRCATKCDEPSGGA